MTAPGLAEQILEAAIAASLGADADQVLANILRQRLSAIAQNSSDFLSEMLGVPSQLGADSALIIQFLDSHTPQLVGINAATREAVREIVLEGIGRGRPFIQMANEIEPIVGLHPRYARAVERFRERAIEAGVPNLEERVRRYADSLRLSRSRTIAATESGIMWNRSSFLQMREIGVKGHIWITSRDPDVRESHVPMDGQCRELGQPFLSGHGNELIHPHDTAAPASETINCRCRTAPAPGGCSQKAYTGRTAAQRDYYWRVMEIQIDRHERLMAGALVKLFRQQGRDFAAALKRELERV